MFHTSFDAELKIISSKIQVRVIHKSAINKKLFEFSLKNDSPVTDLEMLVYSLSH